jgi:hypothetical protein
MRRAFVGMATVPDVSLSLTDGRSTNVISCATTSSRLRVASVQKVPP